MRSRLQRRRSRLQWLKQRVRSRLRPAPLRRSDMRPTLLTIRWHFWLDVELGTYRPLLQCGAAYACILQSLSQSFAAVPRSHSYSRLPLQCRYVRRCDEKGPTPSPVTCFFTVGAFKKFRLSVRPSVRPYTENTAPYSSVSLLVETLQYSYCFDTLVK